MSYKFAFQLARKTKESNDEQYPKQNTIKNVQIYYYCCSAEMLSLHMIGYFWFVAEAKVIKRADTTSEYQP